MTEWIVTSSVLILVVLGLRFALKGKLRLRLQYGLWALVLIRLLIPLSIDSPLSIMNFMPQPQVLDRTVGYRDYQLPDLAMPEIDPSLSPEEQQVQLEQNKIAFEQEIEAAKKQTGTPVTVEKVLLYLWICGMVATGLVLTAANAHFAAKLRRSRQRLEMKSCPLPVYVSSCVETPCLYGPLLPKIYLTPSLDGQHLDHVLIHELTHWRHGDHCWSLLRCMCLVLHWYNPLVWLAARVSRQDAELACDEAVIRQLGEEQRTTYGATLIRMSCIKRDATGLLIGATTMLTTKKSLKERITMIAKKPKTALVTLICVLLIAAVAVGCTFTGASDDQSDAPTMQAAHFEETNAIYVYEKAGFGSDFFIKINRDGTFTYSEGALSSYFGVGTWTLTGDILALTDNPTTSMKFYNEFRVEEDTIVWLSENSTGFLYRGQVPLTDGARFFYRGSEETPTPRVIYYVEDITDVAKGIFDGGLRATFVNVDGIVFVWNHFAVDTLDGLAVSEIGTVTENDITKLPEDHLAACRIPVGTTIYLGKDAENSQYPAVYCKVNDKPYYARFLPESAFHTDDRWWEKATVHDSKNTLTLDALSQIAKEKGESLSHRDLQGYGCVEFINSNYLSYRLYDVETDYRLMLAGANSKTPVEVLYARLYRKDSPDAYIDIRTDDIEAFVNRNELSTEIFVVDNKTGKILYPEESGNVPQWFVTHVYAFLYDRGILK